MIQNGSMPELQLSRSVSFDIFQEVFLEIRFRDEVAIEFRADGTYPNSTANRRVRFAYCREHCGRTLEFSVPNLSK